MLLIKPFILEGFVHKNDKSSVYKLLLILIIVIITVTDPSRGWLEEKVRRKKRRMEG